MFTACVALVIVFLFVGVGLSAFVILLSTAFQVLLIPKHQRRQIVSRDR